MAQSSVLSYTPSTPHKSISSNAPSIEGNILNERIVDKEVKVPKKVTREEVIEKVMIVPETIVREEIVDHVFPVKETIIEVAKPIYQQKIVEVPEIEYVEKITPRVEKIYKEKIKEVPKIEYQERIVEIPKHVTKEVIVEVPDIEYREVEVPEIREQTVIKEMAVPQCLEVEVPPQVFIDVERYIPVPVEAITTYEYQLAKFKPRVNVVKYPLYVPRFIEAPIPAEHIEDGQLQRMQELSSKLGYLNQPEALGLSDIEALASEMKTTNFSSLDITPEQAQASIKEKWKKGELLMTLPSDKANETL